MSRKKILTGFFYGIIRGKRLIKGLKQRLDFAGDCGYLIEFYHNTMDG